MSAGRLTIREGCKAIYRVDGLGRGRHVGKKGWDDLLRLLVGYKVSLLCGYIYTMYGKTLMRGSIS